MSISPTHWMPINGGRYPDIHIGVDEDVSSLPLSPLDLHSSASSSSHRHHHHHRRRSQQPRHRSRSSDGTSYHRHRHTHAELHYHAPSYSVHKVTPPPVTSPHSLLYGHHPNSRLPQSQGQRTPGGSGVTPTLQPQWGNTATSADSISQSRSNSVASCLSSSECDSNNSSFSHTFTPAHSETPFVRPQTVVTVLRTDRTSSEVLAEMAVNGHRGGPPQPVLGHRIIDVENGSSTSQNAMEREEEEEGGEHVNTEGDDVDGGLRKPTVSFTSAFPHPPPPPPLPPVPPTLQRPSLYASGEADKVANAGAYPTCNNNNNAPPARKPQPRITSTTPATCQSLFQHMEGSPHGIQMLAAQSPRLARRKEAQQSHTQSQPLDGDKSSTTTTTATTTAACTERSKKAEASVSAVLSPGGSSNGLSARTSGLPTASTPTLFRCAGGPSFSAEEAAAEAASFNITPAPPQSKEKAVPVPSFPTAAPTKCTASTSPCLLPSLAAASGGATASTFAFSPRNPSELLSPMLPCARGGPPMSMATPKSYRDALSIPTTPTAHMTRPPPPPPPYSLPPPFRLPVADLGSNSSATPTSGDPLKCRPPHLNLTSPRRGSAGQLSFSYVSPLTDYAPEGHSAVLPSLPTSPLPPRASSTTPLVPPLDFSGISDGPLVRDGEVSAGPWWRSTDEASGLQSPCVMAHTYACSGYDEDDDESEDEFADYRPRWRKEEERRQLEQQQQQHQKENSSVSTGEACVHRKEKCNGADAEVSSNEDYIVPGYHDKDATGIPALPMLNTDGRRGSKVSRRAFPSRAAAAYANRNLRDNLSRPFWRSGGAGSHRGSRVGSSTTSWMASVMRFLSVAGTWATRLLAIYISSLLILKTRSKM